MIRVRHKGDFRNTERFLKAMVQKDFSAILHRYGQRGVDELAAATPERSGKTASSWSYEIEGSRGSGYRIFWTNSNENDGVNIALLIQYGHGTGWGGYVTGTDYNPALKPVIDQLAEDLWSEVRNA